MKLNNAERQTLWRERRQARIQELEGEVALLQRALQEKLAGNKNQPELTQALRDRDEARTVATHLFGAFNQMHGCVDDIVAGLREAYKAGDLDDDTIETIEAYVEGLGNLIKAQLRNED